MMEKWLEVPPALQNLDPAWKKCKVDDYDGINRPRKLVPASGYEDGPQRLQYAAPLGKNRHGGAPVPLAAVAGHTVR